MNNSPPEAKISEHWKLWARRDVFSGSAPEIMRHTKTNSFYGSAERRALVGASTQRWFIPRWIIDYSIVSTSSSHQIDSLWDSSGICLLRLFRGSFNESTFFPLLPFFLLFHLHLYKARNYRHTRQRNHLSITRVTSRHDGANKVLPSVSTDTCHPLSSLDNIIRITRWCFKGRCRKPRAWELEQRGDCGATTKTDDLRG